MASLKDLKTRINGVKYAEDKAAMKMVAAAKLRRAQNLLDLVALIQTRCAA